MRLVATSWLVCAALQAFAATNTVLNTNDTGPGSLRDIILTAAPGDTVVFDPALSGQTITLTNGQLEISSPLTIDASSLARGMTLSGNHSTRVFLIRSNADVTMKGLLITDGVAETEGGGGIRNEGDLTLISCTISGNVSEDGYLFGGGGIENDHGNLVLTACTVSSNSASAYGGGLDNYLGILTLTSCTLFGNSADFDGGGIYNDGTLTVRSCTITGNSADASGGGLYHDDASTAAFTLENSIVTGNQSGNASPNIFGPITISGGVNLLSGDPLLAPLGDYGGRTQTMPPRPGSPAIDAAGATTLSFDQRGFPRVVGYAPDIGAVEFTGRVVNSSADSGPQTLRAAIQEATAGQVIAFSPSLSGRTITLTNGELVIPHDLMIDGLGLPAGIAISGGDNSRVFLVQSNAEVVLNRLTIEDGRADAPGSLSDNAGGGILNWGTLTLSACTLSGNHAAYGGGIYNGGVMNVNSCTLAGNSADWCGAIENEGVLTLKFSTVFGNSAQSSAAGFYSVSETAELTLENAIVAGNTRSNVEDNIDVPAMTTNGVNLISTDPRLAPLGHYGGPTQTMPPLPGSPAIDAAGSTSLTTDQRGFARIIGSKPDIGAVEADAAWVVNNQDSGSGSLRMAMANPVSGGLVEFAPNLSGQTITLTSGQLAIATNLTIDASSLIKGLILSGNSTTRVLALHQGTTVVLRGLTIQGGYTMLPGGGIFIDAATLTMTGCSIVENAALLPGVGGGGVFNNLGALKLVNCTLAKNFSAYGGGLYTYNGASTLVNCTVSSNSATILGGGLFDNTVGTITLDNSIIAGNTAPANPNRGGMAQINRSLGTSFLSGNPMLAPLGDYGGPTLTMPPRLGSPVIDAGVLTTNTPPADQRGLLRIMGAALDVGAVELQVDDLRPLHLDSSWLDDHFVLSVSGPVFLSGTPVEIQRSTNLVDWEYWQDFTLGTAPASFVNTNAAPMYFYRIVGP